MDIAYFVMIAIGTVLSVSSLSFAVFQYWRKRQDEKFVLFSKNISDAVLAEGESRRKALDRHEKRLGTLESMMGQRFENRLSMIEGELKGVRGTLEKIQQWFIDGAGGR